MEQDALNREFENAMFMLDSRDCVKGVRILRKLALMGLDLAQFHLGLCYVYGVGVERNLEMAAAWFKKGADQGDYVAQYNLGVCYEFGNGVDKDVSKAIELYRLSAARGQKSAQTRLNLLLDSAGNR